MSRLDTRTLRVILYEGTGAEPLPVADRLQTLSALLERGYSVSCANGSGPLSPPDRSHLLVLGRFPNPDQIQINAPGQEIVVVVEDISSKGSQAICEKVEEVRDRLAAYQPAQWKPWFPVIDYDRCTNCMQCLSFCLFGVYGVDEQKRIQVQHNDNCKTNCPACSRVCPEAAIMFPKYKAGPINGDIVSDSDLNREKMKIDISALLGGDVYQMLRDRSERAQSRFSKERDSEKALKERQKCLVKLAQMGDIPPEVLLSLPSPEEIQKKAAETMARVAALNLDPAPATNS
jgi:NAD-dependent dihydropyrimidine dehydrogenase PreA subunit